MGVAPMSPRSSLPDHRLMGAKHANTSARAGAWMSSRGSATARSLPWATADLGCGARATWYVLPGDAPPRCCLPRPSRKRTQGVPSLRAWGRSGACAEPSLAADRKPRRWRGCSRSPDNRRLCPGSTCSRLQGTRNPPRSPVFLPTNAWPHPLTLVRSTRGDSTPVNSELESTSS